MGLPETGLVVGYVGQIDGRKDPMGVVRFAEALEGAHLLFAGREEPDTAAARKEENQCVFLLQGCTCQCLSLRREAHPTRCTRPAKNRLGVPM